MQGYQDVQYTSSSLVDRVTLDATAASLVRSPGRIHGLLFESRKTTVLSFIDERTYGTEQRKREPTININRVVQQQTVVVVVVQQ